MPGKDNELIRTARAVGRTGAGRNIAGRIEKYDEKLESKQVKRYTVSTVILIAVVLLCLVIAVQVMSQGYANIFGFSVFRVVTGSMEPTMPIGTVLVTKKTEIYKIEVGDIVCFKSEETSSFGIIITHRVVKKQSDAYGRVELETKGDANPAADAYYVREKNLIGKVISYNGKGNLLTNILSFITGRFGFLGCVVFPILLIAGIVLRTVSKNLRKDMDRALEELNRIENEAPSPLLPGFQTITVEDYQEMYEMLKREMIIELKKAGRI
ncbi:MAG: signal peptidase I [Clostridia bacterium]|nr:signal peptidase I [Clostridia bacterium]